MNPYKGLDDYHFWRRSISKTPKHLIDPVVKPKFKISKDCKIGTAGSCFAQHISRELSQRNFNYLVTENNQELSLDEKRKRNYGVFSARYGNIYTVRQLLQLVKEVQYDQQPQDIIWRRPDGKYVDALRPMIEPNGFSSEKDLLESRKNHIQSVKKLFNEMDVFVFTLGLTESWRSINSGTVYPLAPGVVAHEYDPSRYEFINFKVADVVNDLTEAFDIIKNINPTLKVILTVSPVPLIATYEDKHVLVSNTYSKSILRVAAGEIEQSHEWIDYFPSYEIITGNYTRSSYFENDLRSVNTSGVSHVMRVFMKHYTEEENKPINTATTTEMTQNNHQPSDVICDEEQIEKMRF